MERQNGRIGFYLVLIVALIAGYLFLNNQITSVENYSLEQLEEALKEGTVENAVITQNREVPTGAVNVEIRDDGQKQFYVSDVTEVEKLFRDYKVSPTIENVPKDNALLTTLLPLLFSCGLVVLLFVMMNRQMTGGGSNSKMMNFGKSQA